MMRSFAPPHAAPTQPPGISRPDCAPRRRARHRQLRDLRAGVGNRADRDRLLARLPCVAAARGVGMARAAPSCLAGRRPGHGRGEPARAAARVGGRVLRRRPGAVARLAHVDLRGRLVARGQLRTDAGDAVCLGALGRAPATAVPARARSRLRRDAADPRAEARRWQPCAARRRARARHRLLLRGLHSRGRAPARSCSR